ncbi:MAG: 4Fe-4S binding protein [Thermovirgaceae bacterium]|nr:4Fe-4S binding protein [Thermovirgaceae bacterium]
MSGKIMRKVIQINEEKCDGCGQCAEACHEGAISMIDGKAKLVSDSYCDGLGDCIGECPRGAISFVEREAEPYDEEAVRRNMEARKTVEPLPCGCPGSMARSLKAMPEEKDKPSAECACSGKNIPEAPAGSSELSNWPIQLSLVPENAPYLKGADILLAADCTAAACPDFHARFVRGRVLLMGCPKLDDADHYREKLARIIRMNGTPSMMVVRMEVPCCGGLVRLAEAAVDEAKVPLTLSQATLDVRGNTIAEESVRYRFQ